MTGTHKKNPGLLEWIPNISTGDEVMVRELGSIFRSIPDVFLLHIDRGPDVNRTVFTLAGTMSGLRTALLEMMEWSTQKLDMGIHQGSHPRLGALDVCPYVLLQEGDVQEVLLWIRGLAREVSEKFHLPIYLYEKSATHPHRVNLAEIRRGEYEGLQEKLLEPRWKPDFGQQFNSRLGATVMGLRDFLIAYNVNLGSKEMGFAKTMASKIREKGPTGRPHSLPGVKALGWYLEKPGFCQVSTNITRTHETTLLDVYDHCITLGNELGVKITGSELIGLIPWHNVQSMLSRSFTSHTLAEYLGLGYCDISDLKTRVIEYKVYLASGKTIFKEIFETR